MKLTILLLFCMSVMHCQEHYKIYLRDNRMIEAKKIIRLDERINYDPLSGNPAYVKNEDVLKVSMIVPGYDPFEYNEKWIFPESKVFEVPGMTAQQIYQKALNYLKETYKNPDEVIKATIEGEMIKFTGASIGAITHNVLLSKFRYDLTYSFAVYFKDGKYKVNLLSISYFMPPSQYSAASNTDVSILGEPMINGKGRVRDMYIKVPGEVEGVVNDIFLGMNRYVKGDSPLSGW